MRRARFQNKVAASGLALPAVAVMATLLWLTHGTPDRLLLGGWAVCGLITYLIVEINNANALIRIRTRLTATLYLAGMGAMWFLQPFQAASVTALCLAGSYLLLFRTYQQPRPIDRTFHAFLLLGVGSLWFPQMLFLAPFYYWYMGTFLRCLSFRAFWAGLVGLLLPYWFWAGASLFTGRFEALVEHARELVSWSPIGLDGFLKLDAPLLAAWALTSLLGVVSVVHYLHTDYNDKIRVRMLFYTLILQELVLEAFLLLQPQHARVLLALLHLNTCFLSSHYFALTSSRLSNAFFIITLFAYAALAAFCWYGCNH